jgi:hypothetical protein
MHTLDGKPAAFYLGQGLCFEHRKIRLVSSLREIRREQAEDLRMNNERPPNVRSTSQRGYVTVFVPFSQPGRTE